MSSREAQSIAGHARKILRYLSSGYGNQPFLIVTHDYPDPDTIACAFALSYLCEHFKIPSRIVYGGVIGRMENKEMVRLLKIPLHRIKFSDFKQYKRYALLDTQPSFENNSFPSDRRANLVIDQHPYIKKPEADLVILDRNCGATSVILAQCLLQSRIEMPARIATALAYGIIADTLNLYRVGRPEIIETYQDLLPHCDIRILAKIQNPAHSKSFFKTLNRAIENARAKRGLVVVHLEEVESPDVVSQVADFLLTYKKTERAFCTGRFKSKLHVSLRLSALNTEAGQLLRDIFDNQGDAGGHGSIAGGSFYVTTFKDEHKWKKAEEELTARLLKRLRIPQKGDFYFPFR